MKPVRLRPHPVFLPKPGQPRIRFTLIAGWFQGPRATYRDDRRWPAPEGGDETVTAEELAAFLLESPEVTTKSVKIQRALCYISRFRMTGDAR